MALVCVTSPVSHPLSSRLQHYLTCLRYPTARFSSIMNLLRPPPQSPAPSLLLWRNICQQFSARHTRHDGPGAAIPNIRSPEKIAQLLALPRLAPTAGGRVSIPRYVPNSAPSPSRLGTHCPETFRPHFIHTEIVSHHAPILGAAHPSVP